jgi:hypothetical protein
MTLPHTTELVRVRRKGYLWSWHCDRGRRESEANPCKHLDFPISLEELHRQEVPPLGIWCEWSRIPSSLPNERCTSLQHKKKPNSPLHWPISYHRQVWANVLSSGATIEVSGVHNVVHVFHLKRCLKPPTDVVIEDTISLEPDLRYKTYPTKILDQQDWVTRNKTTRFYKVQSNDHSEDEATWEHEEFMWFNYPEFLPSR